MKVAVKNIRYPEYEDYIANFYTKYEITMEKKDKITHAMQKFKEDPERWKNLRQFALSKLSEEQRVSPIVESLLDLKIREVLGEYT